MKPIHLALTAAAALGGALLSAQQPARPFDLLITNARIIDGTGGPSVTGSVAVRDGRIAGVGRVAGPATRTIDAGGKVLAPGFIDPHSHSDFSLLTDGNAEIFDPATVADRATFTDPFQYPVGIPTVIVNGRVVLDEGRHTGARPGRDHPRQRSARRAG